MEAEADGEEIKKEMLREASAAVAPADQWEGFSVEAGESGLLEDEIDDVLSPIREAAQPQEADVEPFQVSTQNIPLYDSFQIV